MKHYNTDMKLLDKDIREPLFDYLEMRYGEIRILEEKNLGKSRADVLMVTRERLYGIEIKSDADTYARLPGQVRDYSSVCDMCWIVCGSTHAGHVCEHVPEWWGVLSVEDEEGRLDFYQIRSPSPNPEDPLEKKLKLLWRPELAAIQKKTGLPAYREKSKKFVIRKLLEKVDAALLSVLISDALFERDYTTIDDVIQEYRSEHLYSKKKRRSR